MHGGLSQKHLACGAYKRFHEVTAGSCTIRPAYDGVGMHNRLALVLGDISNQ